VNAKWPYAGAQPVDRARDIARTLWAALQRVDPDAAEAIADAAESAGEHWLRPQPARFGLDDVVRPIDAAELVGKSARWVYDWAAADRERRIVQARDGLIRVRVRDLLEYVAQRTGKADPEKS
jgi:hypothetical protein